MFSRLTLCGATLAIVIIHSVTSSTQSSDYYRKKVAAKAEDDKLWLSLLKRKWMTETHNDIIDLQTRNEPPELQDSNNIDGTECSGELKLIAGSIQTLVFPDSGLYRNNANCEWTVEAPDGKVVEVDVRRLSLEMSDDCTKDSLEVFDGTTSQQESLTGPLCGYSAPSIAYITTGQLAAVRFMSDDTVADAGFVLDLRVADDRSSTNKAAGSDSRKPQAAGESNTVEAADSNNKKPEADEESETVEACTDVEELAEPFGVIKYPLTGLYDNNALCRWRIAAGPGNKVLITVASMNIERRPRCIVNCCRKDSLTIYDGPSDRTMMLAKLCGTRLPTRPLRTRRDYAFIVFSSNNARAYEGFEIDYEILEPGQSSAGGVCGDRPIDLTSSEGTIQSPGFRRSRLPSNAECRWHVLVAPDKVIKVNFNQFSLENTDNCSADSLSFYDGEDTSSRLIGRYCGSQVPAELTTGGQSLFVVLETDSRVSEGGFSLNWTSYTPPPPRELETFGCDGVTTLVVGQTEGMISSPQYGNESRYPNNAACAWHIVVPEDINAFLRFESFDLEPPYEDTTCFDAVTVYDGPNHGSPEIGSYCGSEIPSDILASTNHLFITFQSDGSTSSVGFVAHYSAKHGSGTVDGDDCGVPDVRPLVYNRIVGGTEAAPHSWPWQVSVQYGARGWTHWCGGSVIDKRWIITAAHCMSGYGDKDDFRVVLGEHNRAVDEGTEKIYTIEHVINHEQYDRSNTDNDICLLRVTTDIVFNRYIKPVCIAREDVDPSMMCITTGWGETRSTGNSSLLNQLHVPIISRSQCNEAGWYSGRVTNNMMCAGYPEGRMDSCQGDSGGPLVCLHEERWRLYGLTSWGEDCAATNRPGIYTRLSRYLAWIEARTGVSPN